MFGLKKTAMPAPERALPGREQPIETAERHFVTGRPLLGPYPKGTEQAIFGMGCFWGIERRFWQMPGVWVTMAGYAGGSTPNPTYHEVCTGQTGHTEAVRVIYEPGEVSYGDLLRAFWQNHDPTQGMRQGNDIGTQYRSAIYYLDDAQRRLAEQSRDAYQQRLSEAGYGRITTEVAPAGEFYMAEDYHQQYLARNPGGYCGVGGTGVTCPEGLEA